MVVKKTNKCAVIKHSKLQSLTFTSGKSLFSLSLSLNMKKLTISSFRTETVWGDTWNLVRTGVNRFQMTDVWGELNQLVILYTEKEMQRGLKVVLCVADLPSCGGWAQQLSYLCRPDNNINKVLLASCIHPGCKSGLCEHKLVLFMQRENEQIVKLAWITSDEFCCHSKLCRTCTKRSLKPLNTSWFR